MALPKRVTQEQAASLAFELLSDVYPEAPGTVDAFMCYVEDAAFVKQVPTWPSVWNEAAEGVLLHQFEFWCLWSSMMDDESYTNYVYTWGQ